jgi:hypothetical protein
MRKPSVCVSLVAAVVTLVTLSPVFGQNVGVTLLGHSTFQSASTEYTDVYFHKNVALIGSLTTPGRVFIGDVTTTSLVGTYSTSNGSFVRDLQAQGNYLYVALDSSGFDIVDISNPSAPAFVSFFGDAFPFGVHDLFIHGNILYAVEDTTSSNLHVIDVSNPLAPTRLTVFNNPGGCHDITLVGNRAYLANLSGGFQILDVTNPASPISLATKNYSASFTHNIWPSGDGHYVATTDETCGSGRLRIWDVSNLSNIVQVSEYSVPNLGNTCVHNAMWVDNFIYMSYYNHGLRVVDVTNPLAPIEVASYDTWNGVPHKSPGKGQIPEDGSLPDRGDGMQPGSTDKVLHDEEGALGCFDGAWGVYAERSGTSSVRIHISDITSGLWAFEFPSAPNLAFNGIGLYNASTAAFFLRDTPSSGIADSLVNFGPPGNFVGLSGDWDGNGSKTIGVYDPVASVFFLKNSIAPGTADIAVQFGAAGAGYIPVVGDWDGNDTETIGLYNPTTGAFFLKNSNNPGPADITFVFGVGGSALPVMGDWDNSKSTTVGVYDPVTSSFFLRNSNSSGPADITVTFGAPDPAYRPIVGNWDGVGGDSIGLYKIGTGAFFLRNSNAPGPADLIFGYGPALAGYTPLAGDWKGPGL